MEPAPLYLKQAHSIIVNKNYNTTHDVKAMNYLITILCLITLCESNQFILLPFWDLYSHLRFFLSHF